VNNTSKYELIEEVRINKLVANLLGGLFVLVLLALFVVIVLLLPRRVDFFDKALFFCLALLPILVIHEVLHACAAKRYGKLKYADIQFGMNWKGLMPYCHIGKPIAMRHYRIVALMPLFVTGPVVIVLVFLHPNLGSAILASATISLCTADLLTIAKLRHYRDSDLWVYDHPSEPGFMIYKLRQDDGYQAGNLSYKGTKF